MPRRSVSPQTKLALTAIEPKRRINLTNGADAPNLNCVSHIETVDFADPNRPLTCLEVDFPIGPVNQLARLEINSKKPIYEMGKWWARRQSSIFRAMLIAAATRAPQRIDEADHKVWDLYYANHQRAGNFHNLNVLDPFMGGGTTLVEGARLGFDVAGVDLNPIAWFVTKTELSGADPKQVKVLFDYVERRVRPHVSPYTVTRCARGHSGIWYKADRLDCPFELKKAREHGFLLTPMPESFDPLKVPESERAHFRYEGPEIIYTFWQKHGSCARCGHRTPVMRTPILSSKTLTVRAAEVTCEGCGVSVDWEFDQARMAPDAPLVNSSVEPLYVSPERGALVTGCPRCGVELTRPSDRGAKRKKVSLTLLIHPRWLKGGRGTVSGNPMGGWAGATLDSEIQWIEERAQHLSLIEVRGTVSPLIDDPNKLGSSISTRRGTLRRIAGSNEAEGEEEATVDSSFECGECGSPADFLTSIKETGETAPAYPVALQCYCPTCDRERKPYNGRFFKTPDQLDRDRWIAAVREWEILRTTPIASYVPTGLLSYAHMTHDLNGGIPNWGYSHWWKMFNSRQLLTHARLLNEIMEAPLTFSRESREAVLMAFQQYLRYQSMFSFYHVKRDCMAPALSNTNFHPKASVVEVGSFCPVGYGAWRTCVDAVLEGLEWATEPTEKVIAPEELMVKSISVRIDDPIPMFSSKHLHCGSATDLAHIDDKTVDLIVTDPPFGGNIFYADLADFFYVWLRKPLGQWYPEYFALPATNKEQEAITNPAEHPDRRDRADRKRAQAEGEEPPADQFYRETLTACWSECARVMKNGGLLAFTFHHSDYQAWAGVLRSLFDAGFVLVATYPVRSDETKGEGGAFGSRKIEYDIVHVCRKRIEAPVRVSWTSMRRWVRDELLRLHDMLQHYQSRQLSEADIRVILRGKALEYYSRHYGEVITGEGNALGVAEALIDINEILEAESLPDVDRAPDDAETITRCFLRAFRSAQQIEHDELHKTLQSTGVSIGDFKKRGWVREDDKIVSAVPIEERFAELRRRRRDNLIYDLDQAHFLIGAALANSGVNISDELNRGTFVYRESVTNLLDWLTNHLSDRTHRDAAKLAIRLVRKWLAERSFPTMQLPLGMPNL